LCSSDGFVIVGRSMTSGFAKTLAAKAIEAITVARVFAR
jgi:hypothetical protein